VTNALIGSYNLGIPWLSDLVNRRMSQFYRHDKVRSIIDNISGIGPKVIADRYNEDHFIFNHDCSWLPDVKYEYKKVGTFEEVCMEAAQLLADTGKTIDFHWSGGIDSTTALVALNEICPKQLHVIGSVSSIEECPEYWNKVVKHLDHTIDDKDNVLGVGNPQKNVWCQCAEADTLFGGCLIKHEQPFTPDEISIASKEWLLKFRYVLAVRGWRTLYAFDGDWLDLDNWRPFYTTRVIQQYAVNRHIAGEMYWYSNKLHGKEMPDFVNAKMEHRDLIYKYTKDKEYAYKKLKYASLLSGQKTVRVVHALSKHNKVTGRDARYMSLENRKQFKDSGLMPKAWGFTNTGIVINERTCKDIDIESYLLPRNELFSNV